jgi:hypothetical protein
LLSHSPLLLSLARHPCCHHHCSLCHPPPSRRRRRRRLPATFIAITIVIFVAVAVTLDSPLCHATPSHLPPNVDCCVIAVTISLAPLAVALFAPRRLPLLSHSPSPASLM